jgi:hypothetical protein
MTFTMSGLRFSAMSGIGIMVLAACSYSRVGQTASGTTVHFPSARTEKDGDIWIVWDKAQRLAFIDGYIQGNRDGHQKGCGTAEQLIAANADARKVFNGLLMHCLESEASFTRSPDDYEESISSFYQAYSQDREVPMRLVFQFMSDENRKTPAQIHAWFVSRGLVHSPSH